MNCAILAQTAGLTSATFVLKGCGAHPLDLFQKSVHSHSPNAMGVNCRTVLQ
jgi:hypothetical protein